MYFEAMLSKNRKICCLPQLLNGFDSSYNVEGKERKIEANFRLYYNKTSSGDNGERETEQHLNERKNKA